MTHTIDMHCDTLMLALANHGIEADLLELPKQDIDIQKLVRGKAMAQFFAIFIPPQGAYRRLGMEPLTNDEYIAGCAHIFEESLKKHPDLIAKAVNAKEIEENFKAGKVSAVLTMEDGVAVEGDKAKLDHFYDLGVRALSLTWNFENCFGYPNSADPEIMNRGLKDFGKEAVKHMQDIGMLVDVSHLSDGGFRDVAKLAKVPFVATHSNARTVAGHRRNLTDDQLKALKNAGGITGLNFYETFLSDEEGLAVSRIDDMVEMAKYIRSVAGIETLAIGTDFDGFEGEREVRGPQDMHLLYDALVRAGFTTSDIDAMAYGNVLRVLNETMR